MKAYVFPGQAAQYPGMGKDLYESNDSVRNLMERANDILGFRLTDVMFNGSEEDLKQTNITQPAVFVHSIAKAEACLLYTSPSPRDRTRSRMPSSA